MNNKLVSQDFYNEEFKKVFSNSEDNRIAPEYFLSNYRFMMIRYIANGNPSEDTKKSYYSAIDNFLLWCKHVGMSPFNIKEQHILYYRSMLINRVMKPASVKFNLTAIRRFYYVAFKYRLIDENPALDVHAQRDPNAYLPVIKYITPPQLQSLVDSLNDNNEIDLRTKTIIYLMAVEGLRTVEIYRMNESDINFNNNSILIRGKGHNDYIYPTDATIELLRKYLKIRKLAANNYSIPVFTSLSNNSLGKRLSRRHIRTYIDEALRRVNLKAAGNSCHMLRHTCGTLVYSQYHDLQIVKQVLRHRSIEMSSKYSHIEDAMFKRYTKAIPVHPNNND